MTAQVAMKIRYIKEKLNEIANLHQFSDVELAVDEAITKVELLEHVLKERE